MVIWNDAVINDYDSIWHNIVSKYADGRSDCADADYAAADLSNSEDP